MREGILHGLKITEVPQLSLKTVELLAYARCLPSIVNPILVTSREILIKMHVTQNIMSLREVGLKFRRVSQERKQDN